MAGYNHILPEGSSINKPPGFDGEHYTFWRMKMKTYIKATGYMLWKIIEDGDIVPMHEVNGIKVPKLPTEFNDEDKSNMELNSKAVLVLQNALSQKEYFRVCHLESAKEIWEALEIAHEGTSGVKTRRAEQLISEFHLFKMEDGEPIRELEIRFTHLINNLIALGRRISEEEQVSKILKILSPEWQMKATAIQETRGESMRSITSLFGSLAEHESTIKTQRELYGEKKKKSLALTAPVKDDDLDEEEEDLDDEEMAFMVRKFKKFFRNGRRLQRGGPNNSKREPQKSAPVCYECKKPGHFKSECPSLQRFKEKEKKREKPQGRRKAYVSSIWGDSSEEETSDAEEAANLCLVAQEESDDEVYPSDPTSSELQNAYNDLHLEFVKIAKELVHLRKKNKELEEKLERFSESEIVSQDNRVSCNKCEILVKEKEKLSDILKKFTKSTEALDIMLMNQRAYRDRTGIGYKPSSNTQKPRNTRTQEKPIWKTFRKAPDYSSPFSFCNYCNKKGHSTSSCYAKKYGVTGTYKWVPKGTVLPKVKIDHRDKTNFKGPKTVWVPKSV